MLSVGCNLLVALCTAGSVAGTPGSFGHFTTGPVRGTPRLRGGGRRSRRGAVSGPACGTMAARYPGRRAALVIELTSACVSAACSHGVIASIAIEQRMSACRDRCQIANVELRSMRVRAAIRERRCSGGARRGLRVAPPHSGGPARRVRDVAVTVVRHGCLLQCAHRRQQVANDGNLINTFELVAAPRATSHDGGAEISMVVIAEC